MKHFDFSTYISPFTWKYGSQEMQKIFSEENKFRLWRRIWVVLATLQQQAGLISQKELEDLKKNENNFDIERISSIEKETRHDVVAAIKEFAEKAKIGGGKIHLGATSMDIVDNADAMRLQLAMKIIEEKLINLLKVFCPKIEDYADFPCLGYTHLQPAEPTTVGYRLAFYAQDFLINLDFLRFVKKTYKGKGFKGAVGTAASYQQLLKGRKMNVEKMEMMMTKQLGIESVLIATQVYPRLFDYLILCVLASLSSSVAKFAADLRLLQQPSLGEWSEAFGEKQVGSSAMPFKKNPIVSENVCSLARYLAVLPAIILGNASHSYLERTLDDSANKRIVMAEAFLAMDQILINAEKLMAGLVINQERIAFNLNQYGSFAATEPILMVAVKKGADRQETHELLREISQTAWQAVQLGKPNPLPQLLLQNNILKRYLTAKEIGKLMEVKDHVGNAPQRALFLVKKIRRELHEK